MKMIILSIFIVCGIVYCSLLIGMNIVIQDAINNNAGTYITNSEGKYLFMWNEQIWGVK